MAGMNWRRAAYESKAKRYGTEGARPTQGAPERLRGLKKPPRRKADAKPKGDRLKLEAQRQHAVAKLRALREDRERQRADWEASGL